MQALKPILMTLILGLLAAKALAQGDHCDLYADILLRGDSLSRTGNYVAAIKTYRAARVACPSKVYETDMRVERIVQRLVQLREQAIVRRDEVLQKIAILEKDLQRARYNEEVAERRERLLRQANEQPKAKSANEAVPLAEAAVEQKDPWDLLRGGRYQEALPLLEAFAFNDLRDSLSLMRLAHANLFNGRIEVAESIYRVLKPLPYGKGNYQSFAAAYLADFNALENAESILGNGTVIPIAVREAYLRIRTDLENYAQALDLAEQERKKSKEINNELGADKVEHPTSLETAAQLEINKPENASTVLLPNESSNIDKDSAQLKSNTTIAITEISEQPAVRETSMPEIEATLEASLNKAESTQLRSTSTHSRAKLEEDRPLPPTPEFVMKNLINTEIENKNTGLVSKNGQPTGYIVFLGDFDLNDYYAQRTLKKVKDQYGITDARIRYFSEVLKYRIVLAEFASKEEAAQYTLSFEQKYQERAWMGALY